MSVMGWIDFIFVSRVVRLLLCWKARWVRFGFTYGSGLMGGRTAVRDFLPWCNEIVFGFVCGWMSCYLLWSLHIWF